LGGHCKILPQTLVGFFSTVYPDVGTLSFHEFVDLLGTSAGAAPPPLDPSFPFLDELPAGIECSLRVIYDSCKGLLLFEYGRNRLNPWGTSSSTPRRSSAWWCLASDCRREALPFHQGLSALRSGSLLPLPHRPVLGGGGGGPGHGARLLVRN